MTPLHHVLPTLLPYASVLLMLACAVALYHARGTDGLSAAEVLEVSPHGALFFTITAATCFGAPELVGRGFDFLFSVFRIPEPWGMTGPELAMIFGVSFLLMAIVLPYLPGGSTHVLHAPLDRRAASQTGDAGTRDPLGEPTGVPVTLPATLAFDPAITVDVLRAIGTPVRRAAVDAMDAGDAFDFAPDAPFSGPRPQGRP